MRADTLSLLPKSIFRAYDIRGIVNDTLTEQNVFLIGQALASLVRDGGGERIIVARDGRLSGKILSQALCNGILSAGCDVIDLGCVPTPLLYYATSILEDRSGVMLTGSHNPPEYNGLKMVVNGVTLAEKAIQELYQRILQKQIYQDQQGVCYELDLVDRYIEHVCRDVQLKRPLKVVIDAGNGITGFLAPALFRKLGCDVVELFCEVDGRFPNHHADPSQVENLQDLIAEVQTQRADLGMAFDGDGDRLGIVTNRGHIIWPDRLLMLYAQALLQQSPAAKVVYDVKCTDRLHDFIRQHGGESVMWKTGHSLIKAKMKEMDAALAGEMSGHFFFRDRWHGGDDAIYAGARLLEILSQQTMDSETVFAAIPNSVNTPELKVYVDDEEKFNLMAALIEHATFAEPHELLTIDGLRVNFSNGWGLIRPSNTSPYLILRFEASNETILAKIQTEFKSLLLSIKSDLTVPF